MLTIALTNISNLSYTVHDKFIVHDINKDCLKQYTALVWWCIIQENTAFSFTRALKLLPFPIIEVQGGCKKSLTVNKQIFTELCEDEAHQKFLLHTEVCWVLRGQVLVCFLNWKKK